MWNSSFGEVKSFSCGYNSSYWKNCDSNPRSGWLHYLQSGLFYLGLKIKDWDGRSFVEGRQEIRWTHQCSEVQVGRVEGGRERRPGTEARTVQSCFLYRSHCNGLLPQGANCRVQEETLAGPHPSFHFARGRRNELKTKFDAGWNLKPTW